MPNLSIPPRHRVRPALATWSGRDDWKTIDSAFRFIRGLLLMYKIRLTDFEVYSKTSARVGLSVYPAEGWKIDCQSCNDGKFDNELVVKWSPSKSGYLVEFYLT